MKRFELFVAAATALLVGACCCTKSGGHADTSAGERIKPQAKVMADPSRIKAVHKVALISVTAPCDVDDESMEGRSGGGGDVFSMAHSISTMKHLDATRAPASLDASIPTFEQQLAASTGWTLLPRDQFLSNPTYKSLTLDTNLKAQVASTRKAFCTGAGMRVLTSDFTGRAGEIAAALGVDAVALMNVHLYIDNWKWNDTGDVTKGYWVVEADGDMTVVGPDGQVLWVDQFSKIRHDKFIGFDDEKHAAVSVVTRVDYPKVPHYAVKTMQKVATQIGADLKKTTGAP